MTTYGPTIQRGVSALWPADRDRPVGVGDRDMVCHALSDLTDRANSWSFNSPTGYRFTATHPISIAETWNQAHPGERPFDRIWHGGGSAPDDWDGKDVLVKRGHEWIAPSIGTVWKIGWGDCYGDGSIIAYRSKPASAEMSTHNIDETKVRNLVFEVVKYNFKPVSDAPNSGDGNATKASWTGDPHALAAELRRVAKEWAPDFRLPQLLRDAADEIDCLSTRVAHASQLTAVTAEQVQAVLNAQHKGDE